MTLLSQAVHHHPIACLLLVIAIGCIAIGIMGPESL